MTFHPEVLLPPSMLPWLFKQSPDVVTNANVQAELLALRHILPRPVSVMAFPIGVVRHDLTRALGSMVDEIVKTVRKGIEKSWGTVQDGEKEEDGWKEKVFYNSIKKIVKEVTAKVLFGQPLCDDGKFVDLMLRHANLWPLYAGLTIRIFVPEILKPLLTPVLCLHVRYLGWRISKYILPVIDEKIAALQREDQNKEISLAENKTETPTLLDFLIRDALHSCKRDGRPIDRYLILSHLLLLNFAATHTTTFTLTAFIVDISSPSHDQDFTPQDRPSPWSIIANEAHAALSSTPNHTWTRATLQSGLPYTTSAIRESMRFSQFAGRGMLSEVISEQGLRLEVPNLKNAHGAPVTLHFAKGARLGVPIAAIHRDAKFYTDPDTYIPDRFIRVNEEQSQADQYDRGGEREETENPAKPIERAVSIATTSSTFLAFSHGPHACPGRFFAAMLMKVIVAELAMGYELRPLAKRPKNIQVMDANVPDIKAKIWLRRRITPLS
jgi:cytochrome P450